MKRFFVMTFALCLLAAALGLPACAPETRDRYTMRLVFEPLSRTLSGEMEVRLTNRTDRPWDTVCFQLWANAFREGAKYLPVGETFAPAVYYKGASFGGIAVTDVEGGEARVAGADENILEIVPPSPVPSGG